MKKTKVIFLKIGVLSVMLFVVFLSVKGMIRKLEPTSVFEIPDTRLYYDTKDLKYLKAERYAMIINPPKNNMELKDLMLDYCKKNKEKIEDLNDYKTNKKYVKYDITFYQEGKNFSRKWKPSLLPGAYVDSQIQDHNDYCLGYVVYDSKGSDNINIYIWERAGDENEDKEYIVPISFLDE